MVGKRIACSALVALLLVAPVQSQASNLNDMLLSNETPAGTWEDPMSGTNYIYGGGAVFKFKNTNNYPLWIDGRMPSLKANCNGISFDGGFLALLGLDDLADQLSSAGSSAAYGVMLGILMSTPTIGDAFKTIRRWATTIQKFLQNACAISKNLTEAALSKEGSGRSTTEGWFAEFGDFEENYDMLKSTEEFRQNVDKMIDTAAASPEGAKTMAQTVYDRLFGKTDPNSPSAADQSRGGVASNMILSSLPKNTPSRNMYAEMTLHDYFETGGISQDGITVPSTLTAEQLELQKMLMKIGLLFFGDMAVNQDFIKKRISVLFDGAGFDPEAVKDFIKLSDQGSQMLAPAVEFIPPQIESDEDAAKQLIEGMYGPTYIKNHKFYYVDMEVGSALGAGGTTGTTTTSATPSTTALTRIEMLLFSSEVDPSNETSTELEFQWAGSKLEALKAVRAMVYKESGVTTAYSGAGAVTTSLNTDPSAIDTAIAPLIFPSIKRFAKVIGQIEKKAGAETAQTFMLKNMLADYTATLVAKTIVEFSYNKLMNQFRDIGVFNTDATKDQFKNYYLRAKERKEKIIKAIDEAIDESLNNNELITVFEKLERSIQADVMGAMK